MLLVKGGNKKGICFFVYRVINFVTFRYNDASYYYWLLAKSCQEATKRIATGSA